MAADLTAAGRARGGVGLFFAVPTTTLLVARQPLDLAVLYGDWWTAEAGHDAVWAFMRRHGADWLRSRGLTPVREVDYLDVPRGRVVVDSSGNAAAIADARFPPAWREAVAAAFGWSPITVWRRDRHYLTRPRPWPAAPTQVVEVALLPGGAMQVRTDDRAGEVPTGRSGDR
ncbi:hypothetical protein [Oleisolibacter albus]|uniref:hypothetical protein n=1 Tax=Oleisolibacter albus TaxID=2171757 RepID=UPI000DF2D4B1|nr:hypothetical protein [Oleisolibacter albus]